MLSVFTVVHCAANSELNILAFSSEFVMNLLFKRIGGDDRKFTPSMSFF